MKIIALTGAKGAGKDTIATYIHKLLGWEHINQIAFADPIKHMVQHIFDLQDVSTEEYDMFKRSLLTYELPGRSPRGVDGRRVVREIGMMMRGYDEKQFTAYVEEIINRPINNLSSRTLNIITDLRFDNEYVMLKRYGAKVIKVNRPGHKFDGHITERGFDDHLVDFVINNDGSLDILKIQLQKVLNELKKEWGV